MKRYRMPIKERAVSIISGLLPCFVGGVVFWSIIFADNSRELWQIIGIFSLAMLFFFGGIVNFIYLNFSFIEFTEEELTLYSFIWKDTISFKDIESIRQSTQTSDLVITLKGQKKKLRVDQRYEKSSEWVSLLYKHLPHEFEEEGDVSFEQEDILDEMQKRKRGNIFAWFKRN
ncbi:MAG: hypothetical protein AAF740_00115 [Bacteroidota bacterium]